MQKKKYEIPLPKSTEVELESGFMTASIFSLEDEHNDGVTIEGQEN